MIANLALLGMPVPQLKEIEKCLTTEAAGDIISSAGYETVYRVLADKVKKRSEDLLKYRKHEPSIEVVLFHHNADT